MAASKRLLVALAVGIAARTGVAQEVAPSPPPCTPLQEAVWTRIATDQLGLSVRDATADRRYTGPLANFKKGAGLRRGQLGGRNWFPADVVKRTLCGHLDRFELFYTPVSDHEADFHPFIHPFSGYRYLTDDLEPITTDSLPTYGEITLPGGIWTNPPWFTLPRGRSFSSQLVSSPAAQGGLEGSPFCIYGPWVFEDFHANQPEIHPAQQMWWRVPGGDEVRWLVAQDISNRFQREMYYCDVEGDDGEAHCDATRPSDFVAWAPPSISGEALVAYELDATVPESRNLTVFLDKSDGEGPGNPTVLDTRRFAVPGGLSQLTVAHPPNSQQSGDGVTGMSVVFQTRDECVASTPDRILGYVVVRVVIDRGSAQDGFAQVGVSGRPRRTAWPSTQPDTQAAVTPFVGVEKKSLRRSGGVLFGGWRPDGDQDVLTLSGPAGTEQIRRRDGAFDLPFLGRPGPLEAQVGALKFKVPGVRLEANFKGFYRWRMGEPSVRTDLRVAYGSTREMGGELLAEQLNETLVDTGWMTAADVAKNRARFQEVFGHDGCFHARLSATATASEGGPVVVPVEEGNCTGSVPATGPPVRVCAMDRDQGCHWFLYDEIVDVQVRARPGFRGTVQLDAVVTDPFGTSSPATARRISFPLTRESSLNRLLEEAAAAAGLPSVAELHRLADLSRSGPAAAADALDLGTGLCGARERKARIVLLFARYVAADGGGSDDYNHLQALARELGAMKDTVDPCSDALARRARRR